jgi:hypothetical protein
MANEQQNPSQDLETLRTIILGEEAKSIRSLIKNVESSFTQQLRLARQEIAKSVDDMKKELSAEIKAMAQRVTEEEKTRSGAVAEASVRLKDAVAAIETKVSKTESTLTGSIASVREGLERSVASRFVEAEARTHGIEEHLTQLGREIVARKTEMAKLSGLFSGFARSFSETKEEEQFAPPPPQPAPRARPAAAPVAQTAPRSAAPQPSAPDTGDLPQADDLLSGMDNLFNLGGAQQRPKR